MRLYAGSFSVELNRVSIEIAPKNRADEEYVYNSWDGNLKI